uniref:BAR domain-containing protein n=1 Tax=Panagrolaimus davidi TaxID=227884 RepID=A0A914QS25_9BILA
MTNIVFFKNGTAATDFKVSDNFEEKEKLWNKSSKISTFKTFNDDNDNFKKQWKKENTSNTINKSTLSLHITAYENSTEAAASDLFGDGKIEGLKKEKFGLIKTSGQSFADAFKFQNPFEFPRQQDGDQGGMRRFWNKMGGNVEQTKMAPDFVKNIKNYDSYKESVDLLVERLETAVQQNPNVLAASVIECPANENPHEKAAASLTIYQTYFNGDKVNSVKELIEENKKLAQIERVSQIQARKAIRHLRRFYIDEYKIASDERNKLNK